MLCSARALIYAPWLAGSNPRATDVTKKQLCFNNLFNNSFTCWRRRPWQSKVRIFTKTLRPKNVSKLLCIILVDRASSFDKPISLGGVTYRFCPRETSWRLWRFSVKSRGKFWQLVQKFWYFGIMYKVYKLQQFRKSDPICTHTSSNLRKNS
jgi:hypothetical protein